MVDGSLTWSYLHKESESAAQFQPPGNMQGLAAIIYYIYYMCLTVPIFGWNRVVFTAFTFTIPLNWGLLVSPSEGGLDVSVPRDLLLDGDPQASGGPRVGLGCSACESLWVGWSFDPWVQIGGLVSFSTGAGDYGRAPQGARSMSQ